MKPAIFSFVINAIILGTLFGSLGQRATAYQPSVSRSFRPTSANASAGRGSSPPMPEPEPEPAPVNERAPRHSLASSAARSARTSQRQAATSCRSSSIAPTSRSAIQSLSRRRWSQLLLAESAALRSSQRTAAKTARESGKWRSLARLCAASGSALLSGSQRRLYSLGLTSAHTSGSASEGGPRTSTESALMSTTPSSTPTRSAFDTWLGIKT